MLPQSIFMPANHELASQPFVAKQRSYNNGNIGTPEIGRP
jgi:hypothetical protein